MILEWQTALAEAAEMSRRGVGGLQKVRHLYPDPGLFLPSAKLTRGTADPDSLGIGLGSILATSRSQLETDNKSWEGETSLEPLTPFRCDKGKKCKGEYI